MKWKYKTNEARYFCSFCNELFYSAFDAFTTAAELLSKEKKKLTKREKVLKMLSELGVFEPQVRSNRGYWSHAQQDVYSWEFWGIYDGLSCNGGSYQSMTECAKYGKLSWLVDWRHGEVTAA